jgi:hypothetical protein
MHQIIDLTDLLFGHVIEIGNRKAVMARKRFAKRGHAFSPSANPPVEHCSASVNNLAYQGQLAVAMTFQPQFAEIVAATTCHINLYIAAQQLGQLR